MNTEEKQSTGPKTWADVFRHIDLWLFNAYPEIAQLDTNEYNDMCEFLASLNDDDEDSTLEVYQWYLIKGNNIPYVPAEIRKYITYSELLDYYILAVTHFGTPWTSIFLEEE